MSETSIPEYLLSSHQQATADNIALFHAAESGNLAEVRRLLESGAKPNFFHRPEDQKNSLHVAAENGFADIVQCLLEHGAAANSIAAAEQSTALNLAARNPRSSGQIFEMLIDYGADPEHQNGYGNSPLHEAALSGNVFAVQALISRGVNANAVNHKGSTPLHSLGYSKSSRPSDLEQIGDLLIMSGSNIEARDKHKCTPLLVAVAANQSILIHWLLKKGANITVQDESNRNVVDVARFYQHIDLAEELRKRLNAGSI